jgi:hypothetical protein
MLDVIVSKPEWHAHHEEKDKSRRLPRQAWQGFAYAEGRSHAQYTNREHPKENGEHSSHEQRLEAAAFSV